MLRVVVEEDRVLRIIEVILDPNASSERIAAFADYNSTDLVSLSAWLESLRSRIPNLYPSDVKLVGSSEELLNELPDADIAIIESLNFGRQEITAAKKLRLIYKFGTNTTNIDLPECKKNAMPIFTLRRRTNIAMAEHTLMLVLALAKRLPLINGLLTNERLASAGYPYRPYDKRHTAAANFGRIPDLRTLKDCTLGLLGLGEIGLEVANLARSFGMNILYHKRSQLPRKIENSLNVHYRKFDELFAQSDFLSIHVPSSAETKNLVGKKEIEKMKKGSFLINTSRADIVNHDALVSALETNYLAGVGCDVHYTEPVESTEPLLLHENAILTPHLGGGSRMNGLLDAETMLLNIQRSLMTQQ
jgi:phosphoglycerate dehydrogenase-like enzyme